jgi:transposase
VDFSKGSHGLAALAAEVLGEDPFSGTVVVFGSKRADRVKILVWDGSVDGAAFAAGASPRVEATHDDDSRIG